MAGGIRKRKRKVETTGIRRYFFTRTEQVLPNVHGNQAAIIHWIYPSPSLFAFSWCGLWQCVGNGMKDAQFDSSLTTDTGIGVKTRAKIHYQA